MSATGKNGNFLPFESIPDMVCFFFTIYLSYNSPDIKMRLLKTKYRNIIIPLFLIVLAFQISLKAQAKEITEQEKIFKRIEEGFANSSVDKFSTYFLSKIYISLSTGTPKNYSANQAYYFIKDFLGVHNPTGFKFDFTSTEEPNPFAWGELKYIKNGMKGKAKVFITLTIDKNQWKISQITIN